LMNFTPRMLSGFDLNWQTFAHFDPELRARKERCRFGIGLSPVRDVARKAPGDRVPVDRSKPLERQVRGGHFGGTESALESIHDAMPAQRIVRRSSVADRKPIWPMHLPKQPRKRRIDQNRMKRYRGACQAVANAMGRFEAPTPPLILVHALH